MGDALCFLPSVTRLTYCSSLNAGTSLEDLTVGCHLRQAPSLTGQVLSHLPGLIPLIQCRRMGGAELGHVCCRAIPGSEPLSVGNRRNLRVIADIQYCIKAGTKMKSMFLPASWGKSK